MFENLFNNFKKRYDEEIKEAQAKAEASVEAFMKAFAEDVEGNRVRMIHQSTEISEDSLIPELKNHFEAKVILVNHEKRLAVDTTCSNLAIKYNFLYISVYQLIRQHIEGHTEWGARLLATKKTKDIKLQS